MTKVVGVRAPPPAPVPPRVSGACAPRGRIPGRGGIRTRQIRRRRDDDAGDGDAVRRAEARVQGHAAGGRARGAADERARRRSRTGSRSTASGPARCRSAHLRKLYGRSVMADVVQNAVNEANRKIIEDNGLKLAHGAEDRHGRRPGGGREGARGQGRPRLHGRARGAAGASSSPTSSDVSVDEAGRRGLATRTSTTAIERMAAQNRTFAPKDGEAARRRPRHGRLRRPDRRRGLRGRHGERHHVEIGSGSFIPGFEEQLVGAKAGDERTVNVDLPGELRLRRSSPARRPSSTSP